MDGAAQHRPTQSDRDRTRFVSGQGRYLADIPVDGALHAVFLRSPMAHARIASIDTAPALAMPGVVAVLTGEDCVAAGLKNFPVTMPFAGDGGRPLAIPHRPVLARDAVRHPGEAVACILAESASIAADAAEAVVVEYEALPVISGLASGADPSLKAIHTETADAEGRGNLAFDHHVGDADAVARAMDQAARIAEVSIDLPRIAPVAMESRGVIASFDAARGVYRIVTPHQGINEIRADFTTVLDLGPDSFEIELPDAGGGFGARSRAYPEHMALALAAKLTGQTVRWVGTRSEAFLTDNHGRGTRLTGRLALDADHRFIGLDFTYETDLGAYVAPVGAFVNVRSPMETAGGTYAIPAIAARFVQYFTNAVPLAPYRGAGRPDMALLVERLVDEAAHLAGIDPLDLRALNAIPAEAFPYRTPLGSTYDSADYAALIEAARARSDWDGFATRRAEAASRGRLRGRGVALFTEVAGGGGAKADEAAVTLSLADGRVTARMETVTGGTGQSQAETYAFVLADRLGLDPADVTLVMSPPDSRLQGAGSIGSRSTFSAGSAVADAGERLALRLKEAARRRANAPPDALRLEAGRILRADGTDVMGIDAALESLGGSVTEAGSAPVALTFPSGCHVAEIELDPEAGALTLERYVAADDAGTILNPIAATAQIHGGIVQGLGEVLGEAIRADEDGQVLTGSFMDYTMPRADDLPDFTVIDHGVRSPTNALGAKGLGEAGTTGALAAAANAIANALASAGADMPELPATPERVWQALQHGRSPTSH